MMINAKKKRWTRSKDCVERIINGEAVLLNLKSGVYYSLNETGTEIWRLLGDICVIEDIIEVLQNDYDCCAHDVESQVQELLDDLCAENLITEVDRAL